MVSQASQSRREASRGFTLVELLLTVALVLLLLGAIVLNFTTLQRGTRLEEGANQVEALFHFARAQAASVGRQVQINFEEEVGEGLTVPLGNLRVLWESDPFSQPGHFSEMPDAARYIGNILDLVSVENVRLLSPSGTELTEDAPDTGQAVAGEGTAEWTFPPITFYPDGSTDSAEIVLASRDEEDPRRLAVRLVGMTGSIRRQWMSQELSAGESNAAPKTLEPAAAGLELRPVPSDENPRQ